MAGIALITGASSGLGAEFARQLAERGHDLVLTARDGPRLEAVAAALRLEHGVRVEVLAADLASGDGIALVEARVASSVDPVDLLVNNAGFGLTTVFHESTLADELRLADVLMIAPLRLTHAALGQMVPRGHGTIVNVASVAGYTPIETYGVAKAWLLEFSRWANAYYRQRGITVTAVAPGAVRTRFHEGMPGRQGVPSWLWLQTPDVVRAGLRGADRGVAICIPSARYRVMVGVARLLPTRFVVWLAARRR